MSFGLFYLAPIGMTAWFQRKQNTFMVIALCTFSWMVVELVSGHRYSHLSILFWNTMVRMGIFTSVGYALMRIRELQILRQDMVNYVVRDLRNPLFVIMAHIEIQKNSSTTFADYTARNCIDECLIAGTRMMTLINSILDLSRLESGRMPVHKRNVPVVEIVSTALREVSVYARYRRRRLWMYAFA